VALLASEDSRFLIAHNSILPSFNTYYAAIGKKQGKVCIVKIKTRKIITSAVVFAFLLALLPGALATVSAQKNAAPASRTAPSLLASLPQSDVVALIDQRRLMSEVMPKIMADNPARLGEVNAEIDKFKGRTGIDPRSFDQVAVSLRYNFPQPGVTKAFTLALARGTFNEAAFVAAGKAAADGQYREEKYQGQTIYVFTLNQQFKLLGLVKFDVGDLAVTAMSTDVLAIGTPETVKTAIDSKKGRAGSNAELIGLATRDSKAVVGFGANITAQLLKNLKISNDEVMKDLSTVRQIYGSAGLSDTNVELFLAARATNATAARNLGDTLEALKQLGAFFVGRLPAAKGKLAQSALDNLKITTQDNELQIRTTVSQAEIGPVLGE
jgi:hypothetical protein